MKLLLKIVILVMIEEKSMIPSLSRFKDEKLYLLDDGNRNSKKKSRGINAS
jgi:hypothetical protein